MSMFAAIGPGWVHGLVLLVLAALLSGAAALKIRDVSLSKERLIAPLVAMLLAIACLVIAVYSLL
jgi:hypothetical protein